MNTKFIILHVLIDIINLLEFLITLNTELNYQIVNRKSGSSRRLQRSAEQRVKFRAKLIRIQNLKGSVNESKRITTPLKRK